MCTRHFKNALTVLCALTLTASGFACECGAPGPACAYVTTAPVVFVGTPVYSNDNGYGTFLQQTLYKFTIDEIFKGLPQGTKEVWVDPGSYTSCYAEYKLGTKLLVFASEGKFLPVDTAAMTVSKPAGNGKPLPPGFDPKMPVYYAPECTGTREAGSAADEIAWLRSWKNGDSRAHIQGVVFDQLEWPLSGVKVTAQGASGKLATTTDAVGAFAFEPVQPGIYDLNATLVSYSLWRQLQVSVPERACGYAPLFMDATGELSGTFVGENGKPIRGVGVDITRMRGTEESFPFIHRETTEANGAFRYQGIPAGDYRIGVNLESHPEADIPYARTYAPGVPDRGRARTIHLEPGQKVTDIRVQLPSRLRLRTVHVEVKWPDGRSAGSDVYVEIDEANVENGLIDNAFTKQDGLALLHCFTATSCTVVAEKWLVKPGQPGRSKRAVSLPVRIEPGDSSLSITLILSETKTE